jgi:nitrite reductase (NADH) small subunit
MSMQTPTESDWVEVATVKDLQRRRTTVIAREEGDIVVGWHDDRPFAMANVCVHRKRELSRGMIFQGRLVCPGHQWAFDLESGYCAEMERSQPVYLTRVDDGIVYVDVTQPVSPVGNPSDAEHTPADIEP